MSQHTAPILRMKDIHVDYDSCKALRGVDFDLYQGEIHGLIGEHRAGKSTLVKLLSGAVRKQQGEIVFQGKRVEYFTPKTATSHKIGIVYQSLTILPTLNAVENIFAGRDLTNWWGGVKSSVMQEKAQAIFSRMGVNIPLNVPLEFLPEDQQQMVELAKVLSIDPEIIIFDEISSKLTPDEMENIYQILFQFKQENRSVIYISHNMDEIFEFADRVTILKNGCRVGTEEVKDLDRIKLIKLTYSFVLSREELESNNRELYLLKKYNENIIKNLPEGIIILDPDNMIYIMNYAAIHILELEHHEVSNQPIEHILNPDLLERIDDVMQSILGHEEHSWDELEYGDEKILTLHIFPFKDEDFRFLGTIIIIEDISKERYLAEYLSRTEKIASIAELAAGVAHEINNPLTSVQNYVAVLKESPLEPKSLERLHKVENELQRIVDIIENLLSFSKQKTAPMKPINVATVVDEVVMLIGHKFKEKQIQLLWNKSDTDVLILGDENRLKQVFINLLVNSIEAVMYEGRIEVTQEVHHDDGYLEVSVSDDGHGISGEVMNKIFEPFFSTKAGKKNTGLGLSICQHIIESHEGIITCSSRDKTTFNIRLPIFTDEN